MPAPKSPPHHLMHRFPRLQQQVAVLYDEDQAFRDLCDVHAICVRGVERSEASRSATLTAEYAAQQARLEAEVLRWLLRSQPTGAHPVGR